MRGKNRLLRRAGRNSLEFCSLAAKRKSKILHACRKLSAFLPSPRKPRPFLTSPCKPRAFLPSPRSTGERGTTVLCYRAPNSGCLVPGGGEGAETGGRNGDTQPFTAGKWAQPASRISGN